MSLFKDLMSRNEDEESRPVPFDSSPKRNGSLFRDLMANAQPRRAVYPTIDTRGKAPIESASNGFDLIDALAADGFARGLLSQAPRGASLLMNLAKAYQSGNSAGKIARTVIPANAKVASSVGIGAVMESEVEGLEAEKRYIENAKRTGTFVGQAWTFRFSGRLRRCRGSCTRSCVSTRNRRACTVAQHS